MNHRRQNFRMVTPMAAFAVAAIVASNVSATAKTVERVAPPAIHLASDKPYHAVTIPFSPGNDGLIAFEAVINGKRTPCALDMGSSYAWWPASLHLAGTRSNATAPASDAGGNSAPARRVVLPVVSLGGYTLKHLSGAEIQVRTSPPESTDVALPPMFFLGATVFSQVVLTIDYQRHELVVRSPTYHFERSRLYPVHRILPLVWVDLNAHTGVGTPAVRGAFSGKPAIIQLDTGLTGDAVGISRDSAAILGRAPVADAAKREGVGLKPFSLRDLGGVDLALGIRSPIRFRSDALLAPGEQLGPDVTVGSDFLQSFRVTFDFPRMRLLLEAYPSTNHPDPAGRGWYGVTAHGQATTILMPNTTRAAPAPPTAAGAQKQEGLVFSKNGTIISYPVGTIIIPNVPDDPAHLK